MTTPRLEMLTCFAAASLQARVEAGKYVQSSVSAEVVQAAWSDARNMMAHMPEPVLNELRVAEQERATTNERLLLSFR